MEMFVLVKEGGVTLIKSTLSNLSTYFLSLFSILAFVAKRIEKIQCDFFWGGINEEFKFHLVSWNKICSLISEGGLGIRSLRLMNQALLRKRLWRFANEKEAWWQSMVWFGVVGVLRNPVVRMGWGYESTFARVGGRSNATLDLTLV